MAKTIYITCKVEYPEKIPEADVVAAFDALVESIGIKTRKSKRESARIKAEKVLRKVRTTRTQITKEEEPSGQGDKG